MSDEPIITVERLEMRFGDRVIMKDLSFEVKRGNFFVIMGPSGCGKSTLIKHMAGLMRPYSGSVRVSGVDMWRGNEKERNDITRSLGVVFQQGALWSSMTLTENVSLILRRNKSLPEASIRELAKMKLRLVGLQGSEEKYPSEISGGMRKRAGVARALALDPEILFLDEPSAGLDPVSSSRLDTLIDELRKSLGTTIVLVSHELPTILSLGQVAIYLDTEQKTATAVGKPSELALTGEPRIREFLTRAGTLDPQHWQDRT